MDFTVTPVGVVHSDRTDIGNSDNWGAVRSTIVLDERYGDDCLLGLDGFSHVEVLFVFDQHTERPEYRPLSPRGRADLPPVGVFAERGPRRPNRIGLTTCRVLEVDGRNLTVLGLDAVSGTPVLDVKPTMRQFLPVEVRQPEWIDRLMSEYFAE